MLTRTFVLLVAHIVIGYKPSVAVGDEEIGVFWQVTDIHYDSNYSRYPSPGELCHIDRDGARGPSPESGNGRYGDYNCDSPWTLVVSATDAMQKLYTGKPDFILWTGDNVPHAPDDEIDTSVVYSLIQNVTSQLSSVFPDVPIYPALGNHDTWPANQYRPGPDQYYRDVLHRADWEHIIDRGEQEQFLQGGFYTTVTPHGLRIVSLNSNLWYNMDNLTSGLTDPAGQFDWLEKVLKQARQDKQKVLISSHVPPGVLARAPMRWFYPEFNIRYTRLLVEYSDIVVSSIYGHEHTDSFRVLRDQDGIPVSAMFMAPAVTPWRSTVPGLGANNPSLRLYTYTRGTGEIRDYTQYLLNLTRANTGTPAPGKPAPAQAAPGQAVWEEEYTARGAYNLPSLQPRDLGDLLVTMETDQVLFDRYYLYNSVSYDRATCRRKCKRRNLCAMNHVGYPQYDICVKGQGSPSDSVTRDDMTSYMNHHRRHRHFHHVPRFMFFVIGALVVVIVILFCILAIVCCGRRQNLVTYMRQPRYVMIKPDDA